MMGIVNQIFTSAQGHKYKYIAWGMADDVEDEPQNFGHVSSPSNNT